MSKTVAPDQGIRRGLTRGMHQLSDEARAMIGAQRWGRLWRHGLVNSPNFLLRSRLDEIF
ncbi:hypothetical protein [Pseudofrankia sp. DC12]|uniref:hypothetical protein n=1 Tax=Pseudofrankia sp. DC12 TaxID=683315 RepID=UPI0005F81B83|nr:hypothetical protein [Pseudofrankia sp. DC12]